MHANRSNHLAALLLLPFVISVLAVAQEDQSGIELRVDEYLRPLVRSQDFAGAVLIARSGQVVLSKGYGMANLELAVANMPDTVFPVASLTKQFTATAILILQERGRLSVHDPVSSYLRGFAYGDEVTIHHLLTHTSGIPDLTRTQQMRAPDGRSQAERSPGATDALEFPPGRRFSYNNYGYVLLARIIERVSGIGYDRFLRENIFHPLGMNRTGNYTATEVVAGRAAQYAPGPGGLVNVPARNPELRLGAASLYSTVEDLLRWDQALYGGDILSAESLEALFAVQEPQSGYGYGWAIGQRQGGRYAAHDGRSPGSVAYIARYPDELVTIIFLGNISSGACQQMKYSLEAIAFGQEVPSPPVRRYIELSEAELGAYVGRYRYSDDFEFDIIPGSGGLYMVWDGGQPAYLAALGHGHFFIRQLYHSLRFVADESGNPVAVYESEGADPQTCTRVR